MTFKKNFVVAIKTNGKILRESKDHVELPFGSEYSVLLKNLDSVRMQARISIDGKDATGWLIIGAGQNLEVERFIEKLDRGNRFKFIERTEAVENHRGIKLEDGIVSVEFKREKIYEVPKVVEHYTYHYYYPGGCYGWPANTYNTIHSALGSPLRGNITYSNLAIGAQCNANVGTVQAMNMATMQSSEAYINDAGITVPGSISDQRFVEVSGFETESSEVVTLKLIGKKAGTAVKTAKTIQTKLECSTCGKKNKSSVKFCSECGTNLEKV